MSDDVSDCHYTHIAVAVANRGTAHLHEIEQCIIIEQDVSHHKMSSTNIFQLIFTEKSTSTELWVIPNMVDI